MRDGGREGGKEEGREGGRERGKGRDRVMPTGFSLVRLVSSTYKPLPPSEGVTLSSSPWSLGPVSRAEVPPTHRDEGTCCPVELAQSGTLGQMATEKGGKSDEEEMEGGRVRRGEGEREGKREGRRERRKEGRE